MPFQFPAIGNVVAVQVKPPLLEYAPELVPSPMETTLLKGFAYDVPTHCLDAGIDEALQVKPPSLEYAASLESPPNAFWRSLTATNRVCVYDIEYQFPVDGYAPPSDQDSPLSVDLAFSVVPLPTES